MLIDTFTQTSKLKKLLALNVKEILQSPVIKLQRVDSTNNYAMQLVNEDEPQPGLTVVANEQTSGRGQRGNKWLAKAGENLLMSIVAEPMVSADNQFSLSAAVAVSVADILKETGNEWTINIKWPNDIIVNNRKAGGILIENVFRGSSWSYTIIGIGLNVKQQEFPAELLHATSLYQAVPISYDLDQLMSRIRTRVLENIYSLSPLGHDFLDKYNMYLFRKGMYQTFTDGASVWPACIESVDSKGHLLVIEDGSQRAYVHGKTMWKW